MRVALLKLERFRGYESLTFVPASHVFLVGEPRGGRSTLLAAVRKVLDPASTRQRPSLWDIHRPLVVVSEEEEFPLTVVELTLTALGNDLEQKLDERLELLNISSWEPVAAASEDSAFGLRVRYCLRYNPADESLEHWVEYIKSGLRVPRPEREIFQGVFIDQAPPLQLRTEGAFRGLTEGQDKGRIDETLATFADEVNTATATLAESEAVAKAIEAMASSGAALSLGISKKALLDGVGFAAEDGSINGLLRAIQPTLDIDAAGALPLSSHGSTAPTILAITEAIAAAQIEGRVLVVDDFGDSLDGSSADFFARLLHGRGSQLWLATRRSEAFGGFDAEDIARVSLRSGSPTVHQLSQNPSRPERTRRRYLSQLLASGMSARTVVLVEGPHDFEAYNALDGRMLRDARTPPLASLGAQIIPASPTGADGGKSRLLGLATIARDLGLAVRVVMDHDKPGEDDALLSELAAICEVVIHLPQRIAVERALVVGVDPTQLRAVLVALNEDFSLGIDVASVSDPDLPGITATALKQKGGIHRAYVDLLPIGVVPPIAEAVLSTLKRTAPGNALVELTAP